MIELKKQNDSPPVPTKKKKKNWSLAAIQLPPGVTLSLSPPLSLSGVLN